MYDEDYYRQINEEEGPQAERLASFLMQRYNPRSVVDLGCATGLYLKPFWTGTNTFIRGFEPSPMSTSLQIPRSFIHKMKLADVPEKQYDLALCLEVMEHIDPDEEEVSLDGLCRTSNLIIFTAAQPGQGGVGHVNCQFPIYWEEKFRVRGFIRDQYDENWLREKMLSGYHMGWFTQNLQIFRKMYG